MEGSAGHSERQKQERGRTLLANGKRGNDLVLRIKWEKGPCEPVFEETYSRGGGEPWEGGGTGEGKVCNESRRQVSAADVARRWGEEARKFGGEAGPFKEA